MRPAGVCTDLGTLSQEVAAFSGRGHKSTADHRSHVRQCW